MRKIGITLWVIAAILAAGLGALLLRTNVLGAPQARSTSPSFSSRVGSTTTTTTVTSPAPDVPPVATTGPPTSPTESPTPTDPSTPATTRDDLYQALQQAAQRLMGTNGDDSPPSGRDLFAWFEQLEAGNGAASLFGPAFTSIGTPFPGWVHADPHRGGADSPRLHG